MQSYKTKSVRIPVGYHCHNVEVVSWGSVVITFLKDD